MTLEEAIKAAPTEKIEELVRAGEYMRKAQRDYFKFRTRDMLYAAKDSEDRFDRSLRSILNAGYPTQPTFI